MNKLPAYLFPLWLLAALTALPPLAGQSFSHRRVETGKKLFFDTRLSADHSISCATCHDPQRAFADDRPLSIGVFGRVGERHVPSLIARGAGTSQFWDGRTVALEKQVLEPITNPKEMDMTVAGVLERLRVDAGFAALTAAELAESLASYVRTIRSLDSPFDRFRGADANALTAVEREGLRLFRDKARCYICHSGDHFTDEDFHNTGVAWHGARLLDAGRFTVTGRRYHNGAFKTPTLREIANTPPYMHDGSLGSLEDVIEFYDKGGNANPWLDENIQPLKLTAEEKRALLAFLRALSGTVRDGL
jgi:cytochrome c peroxidase